MINVLIVDDNQMFIDGMKSLLATEPKINMIGQALNGIEAIDFIQKNIVDVVLMDINMPEMDGIQTTKHIVNNYKYSRVLMLTVYNDFEHINQMISVGAAGYILKDSDKKEIIDAIIKVSKGKSYFSKKITKTIVNKFKKESLKT